VAGDHDIVFTFLTRQYSRYDQQKGETTSSTLLSRDGCSCQYYNPPQTVGYAGLSGRALPQSWSKEPFKVKMSAPLEEGIEPTPEPLAARPTGCTIRSRGAGFSRVAPLSHHPGIPAQGRLVLT
jgi:hypothetical protein